MKKGIFIGIICLMAVLFSGLAYANPIVSAISNQAVNEGATLTLSVTNTAPDSGLTTYTLLSGPTGATLTKVTDTQATFSYTPAFNVTTSSTQFAVAVQAADANSADVKSFILTVNDVSQGTGNNTKLEIKDLDVTVGSETDKNLDNDSKISEEAKPGDTVKFSIEIENTFDEDVNDTEIKDISVQVTIFGIDDDDDLDEEADEFDLDPEDENSVDIEFEVPLEVDEDVYDVEIRVEGEDEFDVQHVVVWNLQLEVEKDDHKILIKSAELSPSVVKCSRDATVDVGIVNIGSKDEDEVVLEVKNSDLDLNVRDTGLELDEGTDDNDYAKTVSLDATGVKAGNYPISVKAYYDTTKQSDSKTLTLTVQNCEETTTVTPPPAEEEEEEDGEEEVEVVTVPPVSTTGSIPVTAQPVAPTAFSLRDSTTYTAVLIILVVIIAILLVFAIVSIVRRR